MSIINSLCRRRKCLHPRLVLLASITFICYWFLSWLSLSALLKQRVSRSFLYPAAMKSDNYSNVRWTVHCFLPEAVDFNLKHYMGLKSIMLYVKPDIVYVHYYYKKQLNNFEWKEIVEWHYNVEAHLLPSNMTGLSMRDRGDIVRSHGGGMIINMTAIIREEISRIEARSWCKIDRNMTILFMFKHCPYYHDSSLFESCLDGDPKCSDFLQTISSQDASSISMVLRWGQAADPMFQVRMVQGYRWFGFFFIKQFAQPWFDIAQKLYCNGCASLTPERHPEPVVPNIAHFIWFDTSWNMSFLQMACISSAVQVLKAERVFIHSDVEPTGPNWAFILQRFPDRIVWTMLPKFLQIWRRELEPKYPHTNSDVARLHVLKTYGGIYLDFDLIILRPHDEFRHYDAVAGPAAPYVLHNLQNSHLIFNKDSKFLDLLLQCYKKYDKSFILNAVILPMRLYRMYPYLIKMNKSINFCPHRAGLNSMFTNQLDNVTKNYLRQASSIELYSAMRFKAEFFPNVPQLGFHLLTEKNIIGAILRTAIDGEQFNI